MAHINLGVPIYTHIGSIIIYIVSVRARHGQVGIDNRTYIII